MNPSPDLRAFFTAEQPRIEAALQRAVAPLAPPAGAAAGYSVGAGGKRVRPLLTVAAYLFARSEDTGAELSEWVYDVAAAVELIHTYSLLHDDLPCMDDDPIRRGLPTAHRVYGPRVAAVTGSALQHAGFLALARAARPRPEVAERLPAMTARLARAVGVEGMVGGQMLDLAGEGREVDAAGLEAIHRAKTAALLSASCAIGGIAAGAEAARVDALAGYGVMLGLAFQVVDDLLDVTGDPNRTGKASGADRARAKATYPAVHGVDGARGQAEAAAEAGRRRLAEAGGDTAMLEAFLDFVLERLH